MRRIDGILIVARKELREMFLNKWTLISASIFAMLFGLMSGAVTATAGEPVSLDGNILYLAPFIGAFTGFILCGAVFFREKQSGVIETLLCTPLDLRSIWLGKVIGVAVPAYIMSLLAVLISYIFASITYVGVVAPSFIILVHVLVVTPIFTAAAIGIVGYIQLALGMRENRIVNLLVFVGLFAGLSTLNTIAVNNTELIFQSVLAMLLLSTAILVGASGLASRLNKEKIVTTIPD